MEVLTQLGIDWRLLIAQIINFVLLVWILGRFLYRPLVRRIETEEQALADAEKRAKKLENEKSDIEEQNKKLLQNAKRRSQKILKEAETVAASIKDEASARADQERKKILEKAKRDIKDLKTASESIEERKQDALEEFLRAARAWPDSIAQELQKQYLKRVIETLNEEAEDGITHVEISSAHPLAAAERKRLESAFNKLAAAKKVDFIYHANAGLVAGIRCEFHSQWLEASLREDFAHALSNT